MKKLSVNKIKEKYPDRFPPMYYLWIDWGLIKTKPHIKERSK